MGEGRIPCQPGDRIGNASFFPCFSELSMPMNPQQASVASPAKSSGIQSSAPAFHVHESLEVADPRIAELIAGERYRQQAKLIFIASESLCPRPVTEAVSSVFSNLYAEGYPSTRMSVWERERLDDDARHHAFYRRYGDRRYYKGCEYVNLMETEAIRRLTQLFATDRVPASELYANVQSLSGAAANNAVYEALVPPQGTVLGMNLSCGGHLTHGAPVNRSGKHYRIVSYGVDLKDGKVDFEKLRQTALAEKPAMIIAGYSAYPWTIDWAKFREIADEVGAYLLADIAHPAGLVAAREFPSPVGYADVVSFTTHKTLCGPRGAVLLSTDPRIAKRLDFAVFPGEQGGPHLNAIAGKAVAFRLAATEGFRQLQKTVRQSAKALAEGFQQRGLNLAYGGTDTHLCLINLSQLKSSTGEPVAADIAARVLDLVGITCNKNAIAGDTRAGNPSGLRFGTTWIAQRGFGPEDMEPIAESVANCLTSMKAFQIQAAVGSVGRVRLPASALREAQRAVRNLVERRTEAADRLGPYFHPHYEDQGPGAAPRHSHEAWGKATEMRPWGVQNVPAAYGQAADETLRLQEGAAVVDTTHAPIIAVHGERADLALQQVLAGDILGLAENQVLETVALDPDGKCLGQFRVLRDADSAENTHHYRVFGESDASLELLQWLRDLSDGMVGFDDDITRKIDGPVVAEDLGVAEPARRQQLVTLVAPKDSQVPSFATGECFAATIASTPVAAVRHVLSQGAEVVELAVPADAVGDVVQALAQEGGVVGEAAYLGFRREQGALRTGDPVTLTDEGARRKPYFIGQSSAVKDFAQPTGEIFQWDEPEQAELRRTPLFSWHQANTKKFNLVPFAGWEMPVMYTSIVEEHCAVRTGAGLFDVSHMGVMEVRGKDAARFLDLVTTNYVTRLRDNDGQYTYTLGTDGQVMDDLLVYRRSADRFLVVVNASNAEKVFSFWKGAAERRWVLDPKRPSVQVEGEVEVLDLKDPAQGAEQRIDLALQGPASLKVLQAVCDDDPSRRRLRELQRFQLTEIAIGGKSVLAASTGYTGEAIGFEIYVHPDDAEVIWTSILTAGEDHGVRAAGLGARDSTRTEAGFPLYGHELAGEHQITPFGAGYSSFVKWHKPFFVGREALFQTEKARTHRIIRARVTDASARGIRPGDSVVDGKGRFLGKVTSAAFAGGEQIVLFYGKRFTVKKGDRLGIFPMPRGKKALAPEPPKDQLKAGDSVLLPIAAEMVTRFLTATEKRRRSYQR